jgi:hypothetical protein
MWVFPLVAALVAFAFAVKLGIRWRAGRAPHELLWTVALVMYGVASLCVALGVASGWSRTTFIVYWALGAVLNVPFLAGGEMVLLFRAPWVRWATWLVLVFVTAYTVSTLRGVPMDPAALQESLPSGKHVFGDGTAAHRLPQVIAIPSYVLLLAGALWSAWRVRGRPEARDRFVGTLLVALGATVIAGFASAFAALGMQVPFSVALAVGVSVMFIGFLRATRRVSAPASA